MAGQNLLSQGKTLGIIGLTQKDWPLLVAAKKLGLNVGAYVDHSQPQLTKLADFTIVGNYRDRDKLTEFGQNSDLVIYASSLIAGCHQLPDQLYPGSPRGCGLGNRPGSLDGAGLFG